MADPTRGRSKRWSYNAGERGRNWVRAYEHGRDGSLYLEWFEVEHRIDPETRQAVVVQKRRRQKLLTSDQTRARAVQKAEELSERFAQLPDRSQAASPITLAGLMDAYLKEVTPNKGEGKRGHDRRCAKLFRSYFDSLADPARRSEREPASLDRRDWDGFIGARRRGDLPGCSPVKNRQVEYDLKFLISVLNWGTGAKPAGSDRFWLPNGSPWAASIRRSQHWRMPRTKRPHRPSMTEEVRDALMKHQPNWQFKAALVLQRDTRRRNNAIRRLDWSDIDQHHWEIRWRGELDKDGEEMKSPLLSGEAKDVLRTAPSRELSGPVFPSASDPTRPTPRSTFQVWLRRAKEKCLRSLPEAERLEWEGKLRGIGFHAEKRAGVRDPQFRALPPKVQEKVSGTRHETLRKVYDEVTSDDVREAWGVAEAAVRATR